MLEEFDMQDLCYATLHEDYILQVACPSLASEPFKRTLLARKCRFMWLVFIHDYSGDYPERYQKKDPMIRRDKYRVILEDKEAEETAIREIIEAGLKEVPKGAEDPEDLKRVWVR